MTKLTLKSETIIATPYELLIPRMVHEIAVHPTVTDFFKKMKDTEGTMDFYHLKREDDTYVESPYALYMCKSNGLGGFANIEKAEDYAQVFYPRTYHDNLGLSILLTTHVFDPKRAEKMRRYAVFAEKKTTLYIEPESDIHLSDIYDDNALEYNVVTYMDKSANKQYWSVSTSLIIDEIIV